MNEQKVTCLTDAAVLADEFLLMHKSAFSSPVSRDSVTVGQGPRSPKNPRRNSNAAGDTDKRECFYCHEQGHLIAVCPTLRRNEQLQNVKTPSPIGFIHTQPPPQNVGDGIDEDFQPFVTQGYGGEGKAVPITILRDTGAKQSLICEGVLPFSVQS